ncbi:RNA-directed DNA polymerase, eukaryota, reverse transcriptase zinc-binding domain protein [Tanacetum coccineum]
MMDDVCNIPVWVKFHDISIPVFTKYGLSDIATKLGKPMILDSYTTTTCMDSWGMASYAKAMVELRADVELKNTIVVVVPKFVGEEYTMRTICVEYEWTLPRCSSCRVFGHVLDECPKKSVSGVAEKLKNPRQVVR